jgi:hypothetical protein
MSKGSHRPRKRGSGTNLSIVDWGIPKGPQPGPWFSANYVSILSCCGDECEEGDEIRADGQGGYEGRCCFKEGEDK